MKIKGWASRVVDDNGRTTHVLFLDYDNILYRCLVDEIRYLIEKYNLPPCYIMKTFEKIDPNGEAYGNYLVYNLKKCYFKDIIEMQDKLSCDQAFKKIPILYRFKCWCARISKKNSKKSAPIFKEVIGNLNKEYNQEISNAHLEALNGIYPETKNLIKYKNKDKGDISKVAFVEYVTASS